MGHPTVEEEGNDLCVRNIAINILPKHSQIADNGWTLLCCGLTNYYLSSRHLSKWYSRQGT